MKARNFYLLLYLCLCLVTTAGVFFTCQLQKFAVASYSRDLQQKADIAAAGLDSWAIKRMHLGEDRSGVDCEHIWQRLSMVHQAIPDLEYVYLMHKVGGEVRFLADTDEASCTDYSGPDGIYSEASEQLKQSFADGRGFVELGVADRWGTWASALSPVFDPLGGQVVAVFGIDLPYKHLSDHVSLFTWSGIAISFAVGSALLLFLLLHRRNKATEEQLLLLNDELEQGIVGLQRAEKEQLESLNFLEVLLNAIPASVIYKNAAGRFLGSNRRFVEALGLGSDEIVGKTSSELYSSKILPEQLAEIERQNNKLAGLGPLGELTYELTVDYGLGQKSSISVHSANFPNSDGEIGGSVAVFFDVTANHELQQALTASENRFRSIFNSAAAGVLVVDTEGRLMQSNPAFCHLVGYSYGDLLQMDCAQLVHPEDLTGASLFCEDAVADRAAPFSVRKRLRRRDGGSCHVQLNGSWVCDGQGEPEYAVVLVVDLDALQSAEAVGKAGK
ncbi:PAS domain S-box-containing protein [Malonomonas rubra DSM 5091]|uniref:PAS domain S-box-containing protein n=1 Tax=Malonomonas rubra DSM 5091 TaxID=1122189 RepID=A0A1M6MKH7_MALRU|nr:PAS domain S-box protein [Malonomonas rubra]SHJ83962.1 PAS domain S-box-containing protein [Malonomonas rubra DSM 5091]